MFAATGDQPGQLNRMAHQGIFQAFYTVSVKSNFFALNWERSALKGSGDNTPQVAVYYSHTNLEALA